MLSKRFASVRLFEHAPSKMPLVSLMFLFFLSFSTHAARLMVTGNQKMHVSKPGALTAFHPFAEMMREKSSDDAGSF
jgi:hypothetical protein